MNELDLFIAANAIADPAERAAYLDEACAGQSERRRRLEALLAGNAQSQHPLDQQPNHPQAPGDATRSFGDPAATDPFRPSTEAEGTIIAGRYKLRQQIGEGGMGTVWMADQTEPVKRKVAVKLIRVERGQSKTILARFEAERQAIALMDHPHIAKLLDAGTTDTGSPFFVMELVKGIPLNDYCDQHKLTIPQRLNLFTQICSAVQHAHQKGIIHRDLKPSNILVESHDSKPVPKVIDFGLAKATSGVHLTEHTLFTAFGSVLGTPSYMAPEQATFNAVDVDTRADVYALGVILYELLTGTTPLTRETLKKAGLEEILRLIREQEPLAPSSRVSSSDAAPRIAANRQTEPLKLGRFMKGDLDWVTLKALSKDRERRYESAISLAADLSRFLNHEPVLAGPPSLAYKLRKFVRRNRPQVIASGLVLVALTAGMVGTAWQAVRAERARADEALQRQIAEDNEREANSERMKAVEATAQERRAKEEAMRNLAFAKKGNEILGSVFTGLDPEKIAESGRPLQDVLKDNLKKAVAELDGSAIGDSLEVAAMQNTLGLSLLRLGEARLAVEVFTKCRDTRQAKLGPVHPETLNSMNNLASAYRVDGKMDQALPLLEETFTLRKARLGPDHPETLTSMNNLASGYRVAGKLDKAVPLLEETFTLRKARLGPDHPETLNSMNNLAMGYQDAGKLDKAVPLFEETLTLCRAKLGPDHPSTLTSMNNLAEGYRAAGKLDQALPLLEETLKLCKARLGPDHPDALQSMNNLALCFYSAGKLDKAVPLFEETLMLQKARLGPDHPSTLTTMGNLAAGYQDAGKLDKAVPLFEETLKLTKAKLGPDHPATLRSMNNLGRSYRVGGRLDKAVPLLEETLKLRQARLGPDHPSTLTTMGNLGDAYCDAKQGEKAAATLRAFVAGMKKKYPPSSPQFAGLLSQVSLNLLRCDQFATAEEMLREALAIREKAQPDAWTTFNTQSLLGGALLGLKNYADAEPLLLKGYEGMKHREKTIPKEAATRIPEALDRLIELYTVTNKPDEAKKYQELRVKYPAAKKEEPKK